MAALGCFAANTCQNIGPRPDDGNLDAAFCANGNYVSRCACCQHHKVFAPGSPLPELCEPWPPRCALAPPPTEAGNNISTHISTAGCDAVNSRRAKGLEMHCDNSLGMEAERLLLDVLTHSVQCSALDLLENEIGLPSANVAILAGSEVLSCSWEDSVDAWTSGQDVTRTSPEEARLLLLSAGGLQIGCAQGFRDAQESGLSHCQARLCIVSPVPTTNVVAATAGWRPTCVDRCRGDTDCP